MSEPLAIQSGQFSLDLAHAIGFNLTCYRPLHYIQLTLHDKENNDSLNNNNHNNDETQIDYASVCGASIILSQFNKPHSQSFIRCHTGYISCFAVSPNKRWIASAEKGFTPDIYIYDTIKKETVYKLEEHTKDVCCIAFSDDSRFLATIGGAMDKKMFIWDMQSGYIVTKHVAQPIPCNDIVWGGRVKNAKKRLTTDYLFASCGIDEIRIWALTPSNGRLLSEKCKTSNLHRTFTCLEFASNGDLLVAGTESGDFFIVDVRRLDTLSTYGNCVGGITSVICTPMSNSKVYDPLCAHLYTNILIGGGDGSVSCWKYHDDLQKFLEYQKLTLDASVSTMGINPSKNELLVATDNGNIHRIDSNLKATKIESSNETSTIVGIGFPNNISDKFITCSKMGSIRKWNINNYSIELTHDPTNNNQLYANCFDFNDDVILVGWSDGYLRSYNANKSNDPLWSIAEANKFGISAIKLSFNSKYIITAGNDGSLRVWDIRFRNLVSHLKEHTAPINAIELYEDSRHALTCSKDRSLICWDFMEQKRISCHRQHMGSLNDMVLSKDQQIVVTVSSNKSITFWDIRQPKPNHIIKDAHENEINCIAISNAGNQIVTASNDSVVKLWDIKQYRLLTTESGYCGSVTGISFSADDKQIVSVGSDSSIMLWNVYDM